MQFVDTHTHPYLFKQPLAGAVQRATEVGVTQWVSVAIDLESTLKGIAIHNEFPHIAPTIGVHPCEAHKPVNWEAMTACMASHSFTAIGETGLDYHWYPEHKVAQETCFRRQLEWARETGLPVIIHNRKADADIIRITNDYPDVRMVFHCFCADESFVTQTFSENRFYSFTGLLTFAKKGKTIRALAQIPMTQIMLETDCPYLAPKSYEEPENEPATIPLIAQKVAEVKKISLADVATITTRNARRFFHDLS